VFGKGFKQLVAVVLTIVTGLDFCLRRITSAIHISLSTNVLGIFFRPAVLVTGDDKSCSSCGKCVLGIDAENIIAVIAKHYFNLGRKAGAGGILGSPNLLRKLMLHARTLPRISG
jgi:hypothetical protein